MQRYSDAVTSVAGPSQSGVSVTVLTYPAGAVATIYSDNGVTPTANPTTTDQFGMFAFYAANGTYTLSISGLNITTRTYGPFLMNDTIAAGSVTSVSVASANGFAGTVATATTTPAITLSTTITGTLQGNGTAISASKVTLTQPASGSTVTVSDGKTLTATKTVTISGTDGATLSMGGAFTYTFQASTDTIVGRATTDTLTNKRITRRVVATATPGATPTINTDNTDVASFTALGTAITSMTTNISGTPVNGDSLIVSLTDDGTGRAITWGTSFEASGNVSLPTTTVASTRLDIGFLWNTATSKWRCVAVA